MTGAGSNLDTPWVWNKGIAALCDHRLPDDFPEGIYDSHARSRERSDPAYYADFADGINTGNLVWVKVDWLPVFVERILPVIETHFILVTGDSDHSMPSYMPAESAAILKSEFVIHWFTQNYDGTVVSQVSPLPIGMDFHTIHEQTHWGIKQLPVRKQHEVLEWVRSKLPPVEEREKKLYIDSQFCNRNDISRCGASNSLSRRDIYRQMHRVSAVYVQQEFLPQFEMWLRRGQYAYVLAHHGNGLDCHRNWEALVLGHVLVVQKSSLDSLYDGLPVLIVDDWREINEEQLYELLTAELQDDYRLEKLTSGYWVEIMRSCARQHLEEQGIRRG